MDTLIATGPTERPLTTWMQKSRQRYPRAWCSWTAEEDDLLRALVGRQASQDEMQTALGRGPGGIRARRQVLGLESADAAPPRPRTRACSLPVPQMDWVPDWRDHLPEPRWIKETAGLWGVSAQALSHALEDLDLEEWMVFVLRYGLAERCSYTLEAVAELLDVSRRSASLLQGQAEAAVRQSLQQQGQDPVEITLEETLARRPPRRRKRTR